MLYKNQRKIGDILKTQENYFQWRLDRVIATENEYPEIFMVNGKILDIGCGAEAPLSYYLSEKKNVCVFGGDIDPKIVFSGKKFAKMANFSVFVAEKLPFDDGVFDAVYMFDILEHVKNPLDSIREAQRVVKKGGYIFIEFSPYWTPTGHHLYSIGFPIGLLPFQYIPNKITKKIVYNTKTNTKDSPEFLFGQFDGLNKISVRRFRKIIDDNKNLKLIRYKANIMLPDKKIDVTIASRIPILAELVSMSYSGLFLKI